MAIEIRIKKNARAKHLRITIHTDGSCVVTVPKRASKFLVQAFIESKKEWIEKTVADMKKLRRPRNPRLPSPGSGLAGTALFERGGMQLTEERKQAALELVTKRLEHFNKLYNFNYKKVSIKNQKTRWGSCSSKGNLNFSYRILFLTPEQADYIIVHELCHLGEMNHSAKFWNLVAKTVPEYGRIRRSIKIMYQ